MTAICNIDWKYIGIFLAIIDFIFFMVLWSILTKVFSEISRKDNDTFNFIVNGMSSTSQARIGDGVGTWEPTVLLRVHKTIKSGKASNLGILYPSWYNLIVILFNVCTILVIAIMPGYAAIVSICK